MRMLKLTPLIARATEAGVSEEHTPAAALVPVCEQHVHATATWPSWRPEGRVPERLWLGQ